MAQNGIDQNPQEMLSILKVCAEQGWRVNFFKKDGTEFIAGYITAADFDKGAVLAEKMGERHIKPTLFHFDELSRVEADWSGK